MTAKKFRAEAEGDTATPILFLSRMLLKVSSNLFPFSEIQCEFRICACLWCGHVQYFFLVFHSFPRVFILFLGTMSAIGVEPLFTRITSVISSRPASTLSYGNCFTCALLVTSMGLDSVCCYLSSLSEGEGHIGLIREDFRGPLVIQCTFTLSGHRLVFLNLANVYYIFPRSRPARFNQYSSPLKGV